MNIPIKYFEHNNTEQNFIHSENIYNSSTKVHVTTSIYTFKSISEYYVRK